jgi:hypothetical protein
MNPARGRRLASFGAYGWAGIDAWAPSDFQPDELSRRLEKSQQIGSRRQKRKAVPT